MKRNETTTISEGEGEGEDEGDRREEKLERRSKFGGKNEIIRGQARSLSETKGSTYSMTNLLLR